MHNGEIAGEYDGSCRDIQVLTSLIREKAVSTFVADWKLLIDFLLQMEKHALITCGFHD